MNVQRIAISYLFCFCLLVTLSAQTSKLDSLEQVLASAKDDNLEKVQMMIYLANSYQMVDTAKCRMYAMQALHLAPKTGCEPLEAEAYRALANHYLGIDKYYLSYVNNKKAEKLYLLNNNTNNKVNLCGLYHSMITVFYLIGDYDNVTYYADKILEIASEWFDLTTLTPLDSIEPDEQCFVSLIFGAQFFKNAALFPDTDDPEILEKELVFLLEI
jgi:hypothetical protein